MPMVRGAEAQYILGFMYVVGVAVLEGGKQAYMWFNLAGYNDSDTQNLFDIFTPKMIPKA